MTPPPCLVLTQGDPAGVGPEILLKVAAAWRPDDGWRPLLVAERAALEALRTSVPAVPWERLVFLPPSAAAGAGLVERLAAMPEAIVAIDPIDDGRVVVPGRPAAADARGAMAALDLAVDLVAAGVGEALVTAPLSKAVIARHVDPSFRGHTDYLAARFGLSRYGGEYLMAFLAPELRVALLTVHVPLLEAVASLETSRVVEALLFLDRAVRDLPGSGGDGPRIALAGLNPHAGEGGLLGTEEIAILAPAVARARELGVKLSGPESPDTVFLRARRGEFDWVLALYHDQGLIAVKTVSFGGATNLTLGLPILRTSVDHGTAYDRAGTGRADAGPMRAVIETTRELLASRRSR